MKKLVAVLMCLMMVLSLFSCRTNDQKGEETVTTNDQKDEETITTNDTPPSSNGQKGEETITTNDQKGEEHVTTDDMFSLLNESAMQMYEAAINDEICVFDERLGETSLKSLRFPSNDTRLEECKLLKKAILDVDQDGVNEYVIQSPNQEYIILRCYNGKVYSYCVDGCDFYSFNTDGTFYWCNSPHSAEMACGLNKITFAGETLNVKFLYSLQYSKHPDEYVVEGKAVTSDEYYDYRQHHLSKESMKFSQFEPKCSYPITAEDAWNLANEYWDYQDGRSEGSAGTIWTARIVLIDTPDSETDYYRVAFQVDWNSGGGLEGYECVPPYSTHEHDQILVNAFTGEITTPAYEAGGKCISIEEAIEIAKDHRAYMDGDTFNEDNGYRFEYAPDATAPDHVYVIVIYKYDTYRNKIWIDKNTGKTISPYYLYGK